MYRARCGRLLPQLRRLLRDGPVQHVSCRAAARDEHGNSDRCRSRRPGPSVFRRRVLPFGPGEHGGREESHGGRTEGAADQRLAEHDGSPLRASGGEPGGLRPPRRRAVERPGLGPAGAGRRALLRRGQPAVDRRRCRSRSRVGDRRVVRGAILGDRYRPTAQDHLGLDRPSGTDLRHGQPDQRSRSGVDRPGRDRLSREPLDRRSGQRVRRPGIATRRRGKRCDQQRRGCSRADTPGGQLSRAGSRDGRPRRRRDPDPGLRAGRDGRRRGSDRSTGTRRQLWRTDARRASGPFRRVDQRLLGRHVVYVHGLPYPSRSPERRERATARRRGMRPRQIGFVHVDRRSRGRPMVFGRR